MLSSTLSIKKYSNPFCFASLEKVFDEFFLEALLKHFPERSKLNRAKNLCESPRLHKWVNRGFISEICGKSEKSLWTQLISSETRADIFNLANEIHGYDLVEETAFLSFRLVEEKLPYSLPPHIDSVDRIGAFVIYLSCNTSDAGTILYEKSESGFAEVWRNKFIANHGIYIPRSANAWHGGVWNGKDNRRTLHIYLNKVKKELFDL